MPSYLWNSGRLFEDDANARSSIAAGYDALARSCRAAGEFRRATELRECSRLLRSVNRLEDGQAAVRNGLRLTQEAWDRLKRGRGSQTEIDIRPIMRER